MSKKIQPGGQQENGETRGERKLIQLIKTLVQSDLEFLGRPLLRLLRIKWHRRLVQPEGVDKNVMPVPTGPYLTTRKRQAGDLLLWVPRHINSYLIDDLTGSYGYSHSSVDTGEIDVPTGKPVMIEVTIGGKVSRKFLDQFGDRAFVRVPLSKTGVKAGEFVECVKAKLGEPYDSLEALTLSEIDDPAKQVCSGIATECLPEKVRQRIAWARRLDLLHRVEVSVHSPPGASKTRIFVSPNGFAEYYGAPQGKELTETENTILPRPMKISIQSTTAAATRHYGWQVVIGIGVVGMAIYLWRRSGRRFPLPLGL